MNNQGDGSGLDFNVGSGGVFFSAGSGFNVGSGFGFHFGFSAGFSSGFGFGFGFQFENNDGDYRYDCLEVL